MRPIRKVNDNKASLTSYYGKLFINRCERSKYNFDKWFLNQLELQLIEEKWTKPVYGKFAYPEFNLSREFIAFGQRYNRITSKEYGITIDMQNVKKINDNEYKVGEDKVGNDVILIRDNNMLKVGQVEMPVSMFFNIDVNDRPVEFAEMNVLGESIPIGFILARKYGLTKLCELLNEKPIKLERNQRVTLTPDQYSLKFKDEIWIFDRNNVIASMVIGGMKNYDRDIKEYPAYLFEEKDVYGTILLNRDLNVRYEREFDLMDDMFVDDISRQVLEKMGEPTEFSYLLIRCCELLLKGNTPKEINMDDMLIKGYERISGAIYRELVKAARAHASKPITTKRRFDINPNEVWMSIQRDPAVELVDGINPIKNIKEKENVTFGGTGGRSRRSMTKPTRSYDVSDLGVISEATVDNQDVGVTTFLSANPKFTDLYGGTARLTEEEKANDPTMIFSTTALSCPCSDTDDAKRILFSSIQAEHKIAIRGLMPMPLCTGYERIIAHRVDKDLAYVAEADGTVVEKANDYVKLETSEGPVVVECGVRFIKSKGSTYKRRLVCDLELGQKFKKGDVLVYDSCFFVRDILTPGQVVMTTYALATTALVDCAETLEDSNTISDRLNEQLTTPKIEVRTLLLEAGNGINGLVKIGDTVDTEDILCTIEDQVLADAPVFTDETSDTLRRLGMYTPKAGSKGTVVDIEAYYFSSYEEMSESMKQVVISCDKRRGKLARALNKGLTTSGQISEETRVNGELITRGYVLLKILIETTDGCSGGDKVVFANQLKSVVARRLVGKNETESGRQIDAWFGYQSISNRIVQSPELIGTTNTLLKLATARALAAYDS